MGVVFRHRKDADFWKHNPEDFVVKGIKIYVVRKPHQWKRRSDFSNKKSTGIREESRSGQYFRKESKRFREVNEYRSKSEYRFSKESHRPRIRSRSRSRSRESSRPMGTSTYRYRRRERSVPWSERMRLCRSKR